MPSHQHLRQRWIPLLWVCLAGALVTAFAEQPAAELRGQVRGFDRQPLADVSLVFHHLDSNQQRRLQTDAQGTFAGQGFPAGRYRIAILQQGQILWVVSGVELPASGEPATLDINLEELRRVAEATPVLDAELQRRLREHEQRQARRLVVSDHYRRGLQALDRQEFDVSIRALEAARELEPGDALHQAQLGLAYAGAGRTADAVGAYQRALQIEPEDAGTRNNLGVALARGGQTEEALAAFAAAARTADEQKASIFFNWGATLYNAGQYAEAVEPLRKAVRSDPDDSMAYYFLGECLFRTSATRTEGGNEKIEPLPGTLEAFRRYLELAPAGKYAEQAADYLKRLGAGVPQ